LTGCYRSSDCVLLRSLLRSISLHGPQAVQPVDLRIGFGELLLRGEEIAAGDVEMRLGDCESALRCCLRGEEG
jgi:hypothetical protein